MKGIAFISMELESQVSGVRKWGGWALTLPSIATTGTLPQRPKTKVLLCPSTKAENRRYVLFHDWWIFEDTHPC